MVEVSDRTVSVSISQFIAIFLWDYQLLCAMSVSQITADLCPVIAFQGGRGVEQGREQILLDVPNIAAGFLHALEDMLNVVAVQGLKT